MKGLILLIFVILLSSFALAEDNSFVLTLSTDGDNLELLSVDLVAMEPAFYPDDEDFELRGKVMSFDGEELTHFDLTKRIVVFDGAYYESMDMAYSFHDYREAKEVIISNKETGEVELVVDLTPYQLCNFDEFCDFDEDKETCPEDCVIGYVMKSVTGEVPGAVKKEDVAKKEVITKVEGPNRLLNLLLAVAVILAVGVVIVLIVRRKRRS